jgi:stress-induced morphogen
MPIAIRGKEDSSTARVLDALGDYERQHPGSRVDLYRQNPVSIRIRIIDREFSGISRADRHEIVWKFLERLPEEVQSEISLLIPLTPDETKESLANFEFDNPIPSIL